MDGSKEILGFPGYAATADGIVWSVRAGEPRRLKVRLHDGYPAVTVKVGRKRGLQYVHKLVLTAFEGPRPEGKQCRHLNGDRLDSRLSNLAWGTSAENVADAVRHGTLGPGMRAHRRKLDDAEVAEIRRRHAAGEAATVIARDYEIHPTYVPRLARNASWRPGGYRNP